MKFGLLQVGAIGEDGAIGDHSEYQPGGQTPIAPNSLANSGAVYLFQLQQDGNWQQKNYLKAINADKEDNFGWSLALDDAGHSLLVGAYGESSKSVNTPDDNSSSLSGAVYYYQLDDTLQVTQVHYLKASNVDKGDGFGLSVTMSGDGQSLYIGAPEEDSTSQQMNAGMKDNAGYDPGAVYLYNVNDLQTPQYIKAFNAVAGNNDRFGSKISVAENGRVVISAPQENSESLGINPQSRDRPACERFCLKNIGSVYILKEGSNRSNRGCCKLASVDIA